MALLRRVLNESEITDVKSPAFLQGNHQVITCMEIMKQIELAWKS